MAKTVADEYPTLWHYTTAAGIKGILTSQELWATNVEYLNDDEELRGFFARKLPQLLHDGIMDGLQKIDGTPRFKEMLLDAGGKEKVVQQLVHGLQEALRKTTLNLEVYVTSFCYTPPGATSENGLLSQWRGYGHDGGYALVFDSKELTDLLVREDQLYKYPLLNFSDVDYHHDDWEADQKRHSETVDSENTVREIISKIVVDGNLEKRAEELFVPIVSQAMRHKHSGFQEEREIRISLVRLPKPFLEVHTTGPNPPPSKSMFFFPRDGVLVPYIALFDGIPKQERKLPIKEIVVGPHPEKLKRQRALRMLLEELEIEASVRVSDIPFLGR